MMRGEVKVKAGRPATTVDRINYALSIFEDDGQWLTQGDLIEVTGLSKSQVCSALYRLRNDQQIRHRGAVRWDGTRGDKPLEYALPEEAQ